MVMRNFLIKNLKFNMAFKLVTINKLRAHEEVGPELVVRENIRGYEPRIFLRWGI